MIALLFDAQALRTVAPLIIAALLVYAACTIIAGVVREAASDRSRHATFWSPPRPTRLLVVGRHTAAYHRREYAPRHALTSVRAA